MGLDESIAAYEEAVKLIRVCNQKLDNAERRVRVLVESADGSITDAPFDLGDET
jgi:exonuclease VII small subunit